MKSTISTKDFALLESLMGGWDDNEDSGFGNTGFGNSGNSGGFATKNSFGKGSGSFGGGTSKNVSFKNNNSGGGGSTSFSSNPRPNSGGASIGWKPKLRDFEPVGNLNKMISVHNIPFFGQTQAFMGKTLWDWFKRSKAHFSDIIDRLNCHIVPMVLIFFVVLISANIFGTFGMEPMRCLRSQELKDPDEWEYAIDYCQSKNTYYVAPEEGIPWPNRERRERQLGYYHWVPIMMFLQAMMFMLPNWIWNALNQQSGVEFIKFIEEATRLKHLPLNEPERPSLVREMSERMSEAILNREVYFRRRVAGCRVGASMGSYVTYLYILIKMLYLGNVAGQFFMLNSFIGTGYRWWGLEVLKALLNSEGWQDSPIFPRLTLCDVPIRRLGDTPRYTLQCHLRINTYNEKIYLFIWWGFGVLSVLTLFNFIYYLFVFMLPCTQENSVRHLLKQDRHETIVYSTKKHDRKLVKRFAEEALAKDGVLLFWFIESHAGPIVARELLGEIFDYYKSKLHDDDSGMLEKAKSSFSSQSTGSLIEEDEEWGGAPALTHRFGNGITPSAPPKFPPGESASFSSSQERELVDGDGETTETTNLYASTPKHGPAVPGSAQRHWNGKHRGSRQEEYYGAKDRQRQPGLLTRAFRFLFGGGGSNGGGGGNYYRNQQQQQPIGVVPFNTAGYYGRTPIKDV